MLRLASNENALLIKSDGDYCVIKKIPPSKGVPNGWESYPIDSQRDDYDAKDALQYFEEIEGKATWKTNYLASY